ncbi:acyl carrier protein [Thioclava sp. GXIMD4216]|uniref:Acyl carrier protein AcpXL n=1 Tax=Thioclava litoralis TaxID=3076557 RepID=A0ABZ1E158_9RHOB|nr:acyl carrier protein [Thioclava sp. FTW29]
MRSDVQEQIISIIAREAVMAPADVQPDMTLEDLGLDSLGLVEMIFAIEEAFDISVPFNANEPSQSDFDISSVGAIVGAVERMICGQKGGALA